MTIDSSSTLKMKGKTILDALNDLYSNYGYYGALVQSVELSGADYFKSGTVFRDERLMDVEDDMYYD